MILDFYISFLAVWPVVVGICFYQYSNLTSHVLFVGFCPGVLNVIDWGLCRVLLLWVSVMCLHSLSLLLFTFLWEGTRWTHKGF